MKQRNTPYGYTVRNGENILHPKESHLVLRIFTNYLGGASFLRIAQSLTAEKVDFLPDRCDWNKNRIKRILEDTRYLGTNTYPAIIDADMHRQAQAVKDSNNNQNRKKSEIPFRLPCSVSCSCGALMKRRSDARRKLSQQLWRCTDSDCKRIVNMNDDILLANITQLLNRLINNSTIIQAMPVEPDLPLEVRRLNNEVTRQLDGFEIEKEQIKAAIFSLATEKYRHTDNKKVITQMLRAEFEKQTPLSLFSPELLGRTADRLWFDYDGEPVLVLKNGQNIRKEPGYADSNNTGVTTAD